MKRIRKIIKYIFWLFILLIIATVIINILVSVKSKKYIYTEIKSVPECYTAIVLGALVYHSGYPSDYLKDRMDVAIELYKNKKVKRFLLSGDHGRKNYDEVNNMKKYFIDNGINTEDIFLDHAGFDTYNTMVRAKEIFQVTDAIIVTQEFHLSRAVYLARSKGITAFGIKADKRSYAAISKLKIRETIANVKAFIEVLINKNPKFLGSKIPITGNSKLSYD